MSALIQSTAVTMSSREIAKLVEKRHDNVKRTIETLVNQAVIESPQVEEISTATKPVSMYVFSGDRGKRDSIVVVAQLSPMFTARLVDRWQELERAIVQPLDGDRIASRLNGKVARRSLTDVVAEFVNYATAQGSKSASMYYMSITKMEYRALFLVEKAVGQGFRDTLTAIQNSQLATAEALAQRELLAGMEAGEQYKEIYQRVKRKIEALVGIIGISVPGDDRRMIAA